jgi:hypothetical protein
MGHGPQGLLALDLQHLLRQSMEMPLFWRPISQISQNHLVKAFLAL